MADKNISILLLTGPPGVGKTTLVRKVCLDLLETHKIICDGFYTEEVRDSSRQRIGFDITTIAEKRTSKLARVDANIKGPYVGKYGVFVKEFEDLALPLLRQVKTLQLLVLDEIGKMELKSKRFESAVYNCLEAGGTILATVPFEMRQPLTLVEKLKKHPHSKTIVVTKDNRNHLQSEIIEYLLNTIKK
ncbi:cancer-related nucleoside-triphosphatase homolog [Musca vetustissima]|uniref:cancer-related nucleoside-triphosphatase homolog n=1 Tax=Musca vetustissima TaxID=27455 RepID=UPI002AB7E482|nr:cancer-related nucleoside-triphosphatase homolog [Musca vetustissima]